MFRGSANSFREPGKKRVDFAWRARYGYLPAWTIYVYNRVSAAMDSFPGPRRPVWPIYGGFDHGAIDFQLLADLVNIVLIA